MICTYKVINAERQGFEPWVPQSRTAVFETAPFDHSGTSPKNWAKIYNLYVFALNSYIKFCNGT